MEFNIEKPFSKKNIIKKRKKEKIFKKMLYILSFIISVAFFPFFYEITQNEFSSILDAIIYTAIISIFVGGLFFSILLFSTANKHKFSFQNFEYINHKKCTNLLESAELNREIKNYIIQVSEQGRQVTNYEYEQFDIYLKRENKRIIDEKHQENCNKLYNELAGS